MGSSDRSRLPVKMGEAWVGMRRSDWIRPGRWAGPGCLEHGPDDLAAVGGGQNSERA